MRLLKNNKLKILAATSVTIFSLLVLFVGTFAWFESQLNQNRDADEFNVTTIDGKLKNIYFHNVESVVMNHTTEKPVSFTFEDEYCGMISYNWETNTATYDGDTSISLPEYNPLEHDHPLLMVFEFDDVYTSSIDGDIFIRATTDVEGYLGERDANSAPVYNLLGNGIYHSETVGTETSYYYALSSVVNFYCTHSASELYNKTGETNTTLINPTFNYADLQTREQSIEALEDDEDAVVPDLCFTSINNSNDTSSFNQNPTLFTSNVGDSIKYICVIVDYYSDAIEYIYSTYLGNDILEYTFHNELHYLCDWGLEVS